MRTPALYLLPPINPTPRTLNPVTVLLEALAHIARTPCTAARNANERRELIYYDAISHLAATQPEVQQQATYDRLAAKLPTTAGQVRTATLAAYGWACDRAANGSRHQGRTTWEAAAIAALELYRHRPLTTLSGRPATPAAVTA